MLSFFICLALLIGGYFVYGKMVDNTFGTDDRETPAVRINERGRLRRHASVEAVPGAALKYRGIRPDIRSASGSIMGPGCLSVDYIRYNLCRRYP